MSVELIDISGTALVYTHDDLASLPSEDFTSTVSGAGLTEMKKIQLLESTYARKISHILFHCIEGAYALAWPNCRRAWCAGRGHAVSISAQGIDRILVKELETGSLFQAKIIFEDSETA